MSAEEAYQHLKALWQQFKSASQQLKIPDKFSPISLREWVRSIVAN